MPAQKYCIDGLNLIKKAFLEEQEAEGFIKENKGGPLTALLIWLNGVHCTKYCHRSLEAEPEIGILVQVIY